MSSNLPCGVTDAMCEPNDPACGRCGHYYSDHFYEDGEEPMMNHEKLERNRDGGDSQDIEYNADGEVIHACNMLEGIKSNKNQCDCEGFSDEPYEPDYDNWRDE